MHDAQTLSDIRECLVLVRVWNVAHRRSLLQFKGNVSSLDVLAEMFKAITKVRSSGHSLTRYSNSVVIAAAVDLFVVVVYL